MTKRKYTILIALAALFIALSSMLCFGGSKSASAATVTDQTGTYVFSTARTEIERISLSGRLAGSGSNYVSNGVVFSFSPSYLEIDISPKTTLSKYYYYYGVSGVTLSGPSRYSSSTSYSNNSSRTKSVNYNLPILGSGSYTLTIKVFSQLVESGSETDRKQSSVDVRFSVDMSAPTISGATALETGLYTNKEFTVTAKDSISGVNSFYVSEPDATTYERVSGSSVTIPLGSKNGLYRFMASDVAGNTSGTFYVNFDDVAPDGEVITVSGNKVSSGQAVNESFSFTAKDNSSGIAYVEYKKPDTDEWLEYEQGAIISGNDGYGEYSFRVTDLCGNELNYTVTLEDDCSGGHNYVISNKIQPTCTSGGYTIYTCSVCGYSMKGDFTAALGHDYKATTAVADCTSGGVTTYKCSRCGDSYTEQTSGAMGHNYVVKVTQATCTTGGYTKYTCSRCGDTYTDGQTQPLGHSFTGQAQPATCTEGGGNVYTCTRCGYQYSDNDTAALGHSYIGRTISPTCEDGGYTEYTCSRCGDNYTDNRTQPLGHNFITTIEEVTCTQPARTVYTCQICGYVRSENTGEYPKGHSYTSSVITSATCTTNGERLYHCDNCGDEYTAVIPATGHNYAISDTVSKDGITTRTYTCTACGDSYTQELGDQYEEVSSYIEYLFDMYSPYMIWVFLAASGIWSIVLGVMFAIAHKNDDKEKAKKMIVNYAIGMIIIFVILVACPFLINGIAGLIT